MIERKPHLTDWFTEWMFYQYGLVYMGARMLNNISAVSQNFSWLFLVYFVVLFGYGAWGEEYREQWDAYCACYISTDMLHHLGPNLIINGIHLPQDWKEEDLHHRSCSIINCIYCTFGKLLYAS